MNIENKVLKNFLRATAFSITVAIIGLMSAQFAYAGYCDTQNCVCSTSADCASLVGCWDADSWVACSDGADPVCPASPPLLQHGR